MLARNAAFCKNKSNCLSDFRELITPTSSVDRELRSTTVQRLSCCVIVILPLCFTSKHLTLFSAETHTARGLGFPASSAAVSGQ